MDTQEALRFFAQRQWTQGNMKLGCLCPLEYIDFPSQNNYGLFSDAIIQEYNATHYSREWNEQGKSVKIILYSAEAFGAASNLKPLTEMIIEVNDESKVPI